MRLRFRFSNHMVSPSRHRNQMNAFHLNYAAIFESDINILTLFHLVDLTFED